MTITLTQANPKSTTTVIYPSGSGCSTEWTSSVVSNWVAVSGDSYYVSMSTDSVLTDSYSVSSIPSIGEIRYVNLKTEAKSVNYTLAASGYLQTRISNSGCTNYFNYDIDITESYKEKVTLINPNNRDINPLTSKNWEWDDFDDLQIGIIASSVTKDVVAEEILMPNSVVTGVLSPQLYEGDWDCPMGMNCSYEAVNDYPLDTSMYMFRTSYIGWVDSKELAFDGHNLLADLVVSDNDIIHVLADEYIEAFSSASGSLNGALRTYDIGHGSYFTGAHISVISSGATDYLLLADNAGGRVITGFSMDTSSPSTYYVQEDEYETSKHVLSDSCNDGTYHYIAQDDDGTNNLLIYSIDFSSSSIVIKDTIELSNVKAENYDEWDIGIACTNTGHITVLTRNSDGGANPNRYAILYSLTVDGSGNLTLEDTDAKLLENNGAIDTKHGTIDVGSEIITVATGSNGFEIYQINDSTGAITHKRTRDFVDGERRNTASRAYAFEYDGKYYFGTSYAGMRIYEIDTDDYDVELVGRRGRCSDDPFNESGHLSSIGHIEEDGKLYLFTHEDYLHSYRLFDYYDTFGFENPPTLGTINNVQVKFVQNNYCGDECLYRVHLFSNGSEVSDEIYCNENTEKLLTFTFDTDPDTGAAWTQSAVTDISAGIEIIPNTNPGCLCDGEHRISQVYLQVNHTLTDVSPEIRVKKQYLEIGYIPTASTATLNTPEDISVSNSRNLNKINFWNGSREVYDLGRSNKSMSISGMEWENGEDKIEAIRNMGLNGSDVEITGFSFSPLNRTYKIKSLNWEQVSINPDVWKWKIDLEEVNIEEICGDE